MTITKEEAHQRTIAFKLEQKDRDLRLLYSLINGQLSRGETTLGFNEYDKLYIGDIIETYERCGWRVKVKKRSIIHMITQHPYFYLEFS